MLSMAVLITKIHPGSVRVRVTRQVSVTYWSALNMVEVTERGKVVRSEIAPPNYTASQFARTVDRVRAWYNQN